MKITLSIEALLLSLKPPPKSEFGGISGFQERFGNIGKVGFGVWGGLHFRVRSGFGSQKGSLFQGAMERISLFGGFTRVHVVRCFGGVDIFLAGSYTNVSTGILLFPISG